MLGQGSLCKSSSANLEEWMFLDLGISAAISNECQLGLDVSVFAVASSYRQEKSDNIVSPPCTSGVKKLKCLLECRVSVSKEGRRPSQNSLSHQAKGQQVLSSVGN